MRISILCVGDKLVQTNHNWINGRLNSCYCGAVSRNKIVTFNFMSDCTQISTGFIINTLIRWTHCTSPLTRFIFQQKNQSDRDKPTILVLMSTGLTINQAYNSLPQYVTLLTEWFTGMQWNKVIRFHLLDRNNNSQQNCSLLNQNNEELLNLLETKRFLNTI
jgi:hypothetical protein